MSDFSLCSSRFTAIGLSHLLMNAYVAALLPLVHLLLQQTGAGGEALAFCVAAFVLGMLLPGAFSAYLLERYSRKMIFTRAVSVLTLAGSAALFAFQLPELHHITAAAFYVVTAAQGTAYGLAQTALGTTLVNDLTPTTHRTRANNAYAWYGRFGLPLGLMAGANLPLWLQSPGKALLLTAACGLAAMLLVTGLHVPVKAPVKVDVLALDRFLLPRALPRTVASMFTAFALGCTVEANMHAGGWLFMLLGLLLARCLPNAWRYALKGRPALVGGLALTAVAFGCLTTYTPLPTLTEDLSHWTENLSRFALFAALGAGSALTLERSLLALVDNTDHCQRGTAQSTYFLTYAIAFAAGCII